MAINHNKKSQGGEVGSKDKKRGKKERANEKEKNLRRSEATAAKVRAHQDGETEEVVVGETGISKKSFYTYIAA